MDGKFEKTTKSRSRLLARPDERRESPSFDPPLARSTIRSRASFRFEPEQLPARLQQRMLEARLERDERASIQEPERLRVPANDHVDLRRGCVDRAIHVDARILSTVHPSQHRRLAARVLRFFCVGYAEDSEANVARVQDRTRAAHEQRRKETICRAGNVHGLQDI
jgi:hypothetical protein